MPSPNKVLGKRVTPEQRQAIKNAAAIRGVTVEEYLDMLFTEHVPGYERTPRKNGRPFKFDRPTEAMK